MAKMKIRKGDTVKMLPRQGPRQARPRHRGRAGQGARDRREPERDQAPYAPAANSRTRAEWVAQMAPGGVMERASAVPVLIRDARLPDVPSAPRGSP